MSQPTRILLSLVVGLGLGILVAAWASQWVEPGIAIAAPIGDTWLNGLRMTIVPLVVALLITGIANTTETARSGRITARSLIMFMAFLWAASALAAFLTPAFLSVWPLPAESATALRSALSSVHTDAKVPGFADFMRSIVPTNPIAAAANDAILPLIVFTMAFAFAVTRLPAEQRKVLTAFFEAVSDAMLVIINWVLWLAPIGVSALAFVVGARAGTAAVGALAHYIIIVSGVGIVVGLLAYPVAVIGGRLGLMRFARAIAPAQAVAASTQSSLASLPAMLKGAGALGIPVSTSGVVLPLAVAIFRVTAPPMNLAVVLYIANWYGITLGPAQIAAGIAAAAITTFSGVGLPGQITYITSIAPIALAIGVPIEALGLLIAVETIPDIFRTIGNVMMDLAVTATVAARSGPPGALTETDEMLMETNA